jgi:hypothetical protein
MQGLGGAEIKPPQLEPPLQLRLGQGRRPHRARPHDRPHRQAVPQGFIPTTRQPVLPDAPVTATNPLLPFAHG